MDLSIVIVNFNGDRYIADCLESVFASRTGFSFEVIVVDNASTDDSLSVLRKFGDRIRLISNAKNEGFSFANNQGIRVGKGKYVFLLNNDTVLKDDTLQILLSYYEKNPHLGAIAPRLLNSDGSVQFYGNSFSHWLYGGNEPKNVAFLSGAAFLSTRKNLDEVGGLDENFFFYNEDVDLCKSLAKMGKKLVYLPSALLIHYGGLATATVKAPSLIEGYRGGLYLCRKHYAAPVFWLYRGVVILISVIQFVWEALRGVFDERRRPIAMAFAKIAWIAITNNIERPKR